MTTPDDLSGLDGPRLDPADGLDDAALTIAICICSAREVSTARMHRPDAHPNYLIGLDDLSVSRNIVARLLNAGWTPPA